MWSASFSEFAFSNPRNYDDPVSRFYQTIYTNVMPKSFKTSYLTGITNGDIRQVDHNAKVEQPVVAETNTTELPCRFPTVGSVERKTGLLSVCYRPYRADVVLPRA